MCLQILVLGLSVLLALNVKYLSQLVKHFVKHHVILTMEDVQQIKNVHCRQYNVSELLVHQVYSVLLVSIIENSIILCSSGIWCKCLSICLFIDVYYYTAIMVSQLCEFYCYVISFTCLRIM